MVNDLGMSEKKTAYHEAGHTVVAWALHMGVKEVTIVPDHEAMTAGIMEHDSEYHQQQMDIGEEATHQRRAVQLMAGHYAQVRWDPALGDEGCEHDYREAADHIEHLCYSNDDAENRMWWDLMRYRVKALVEHYWPEIEVLATELQQLKTIPGDQALKIIWNRFSADEGRRRLFQ